MNKKIITDINDIGVIKSGAGTEREVIISFNDIEDNAHIYIGSNSFLTKIKNKMKENFDSFVLTEYSNNAGEITNYVAECSKRLISIRTKIQTREMTEEQKQKMVERMKKARGKGE